VFAALSNGEQIREWHVERIDKNSEWIVVKGQKYEMEQIKPVYRDEPYRAERDGVLWGGANSGGSMVGVEASADMARDGNNRSGVFIIRNDGLRDYQQKRPTARTPFAMEGN